MASSLPPAGRPPQRRCLLGLFYLLCAHGLVDGVAAAAAAAIPPRHVDFSRTLLQQSGSPSPPGSREGGLPAGPPPGAPRGPDQCLVTATYLTNLELGGVDVPLFIGTFNMQAAPSVNASSWVLSWRFTEGEVIHTRGDILPTGAVNVLAALALQPQPVNSGPQGLAIFSNSTLPQLAPTSSSSSSSSSSVLPPLALSFIAHKGPVNSSGGSLPRAVAAGAGGNASSSTFMGVGPPADVVFNGLQCSLLPPGVGAPAGAAGQGGGAGLAIASRAEPLLQGTWPQILQVQYMPVEYQTAQGTAQGLFAQFFSQFFFSVTNKGSNSTISLDDIMLQYWFAAPQDDTQDPVPSSVTLGNTSSSGGSGGGEGGSSVADKFKMSCADVSKELTLGCDALVATFKPGLPGVTGASYVMELTFKAGSGLLLPAGTPPDNSSLVAALLATVNVPTLRVLQAIVSIETQRYMSSLDVNLDYSYLDTPRRNAPDVEVQQNSKVVPRSPLPNPRLPAYVAGLLAWGSPPRAGASQPLPPPGTVAMLPPGMTCKPSSTGTSQVCSINVTYCCQSDPPTVPGTPFVSSVPADWQERWRDNYVSSQELRGAKIQIANLPAVALGPLSPAVSDIVQPPKPGGGRSKPSKGVIAGAVVGSFVGAGLIAFLVLLLTRGRRYLAYVERRDTQSQGLLGQQGGTAGLAPHGAVGRVSRGYTPRDGGTETALLAYHDDHETRSSLLSFLCGYSPPDSVDRVTPGRNHDSAFGLFGGIRRWTGRGQSQGGDRGAMNQEPAGWDGDLRQLPGDRYPGDAHLAMSMMPGGNQTAHFDAAIYRECSANLDPHCLSEVG
ncbi:hypothetical protein V8C86DRAFT_443776 [Haematococcus lacustris]